MHRALLLPCSAPPSALAAPHLPAPPAPHLPALPAPHLPPPTPASAPTHASQRSMAKYPLVVQSDCTADVKTEVVDICATAV